MEKTSIKKNFIYQMIYEVLILILPFITSPYIARVIGAEGLGIYSFTHTIANYFILFSMLGLKNYGNRAIAQTRDNREKLNSAFSDILAVHVIVSVFCCLVYVGYVVFVASDKLYAAIQGFLVVSGLFDISWFYFGIEKFKLTVTRNTIIKIVNVICIFIFVRTSTDLWKYCLIMALGMLISQLTLWIPLKRYVSIVKPNIKNMQKHIKPLLILFIPAIAVSLYKYMDKIMLGTMSSKEQLGFYENAEKVINIPMTIITSFGTVMLPKMSNLAANKDKKQTQKYMAISMQFVMCMACALSFGLAAVGTVFAPFFWGSEFTPSGTLIMYLSITIPFLSFANILRTQYLIPNEKDRDYITSVIIGAVMNLIINALLIPSMEAKGATFGTVAAEISVCLVQTLVVRRDLPILQYVKSFVIFILIGILTFVTSYGIGKMGHANYITLFLQIAAGAVVYLVGSVLYFVITKNETFLKMVHSGASKLNRKK